MAKKKKTSRTGRKKPVAKKKPATTKPAKVKVVRVTKVVKAVGSVSYHKKEALKQVKEELAWLLLARDQEKRKGERNKLTKKVRLKRIEYNKLK